MIENYKQFLTQLFQTVQEKYDLTKHSLDTQHEHVTLIVY